MCGITGFFQGQPPGDRRQVLRGMTDAIAHRGPDADGHWLDDDAGIALGHRRLSILDLSPNGAQPMHSRDGRWVLSYNGEVYNFSDLRAELEQGETIAWRGHSDTEVLLEGVMRWGVEATLRRAEGMFALALWDRRERTLHLARDRFGEKPLYYGRVGDALVFGSELKALRAYPGFAAAIDRGALAEFMRLGHVPSPMSIHEGVRKLPAGCWLSVGPQGGEVQPVPYWSAVEAAMAARERPFGGTMAEAVDRLDALLRASVGRRMVADVPLGAMLSGGIDSSVVVALMQAQRGDRVRTFSIGSREPGYDEATHARAVAAHLGTEHTELYVEAADALAVVPRLHTLYDEPFADSSQVPSFLVSSLARRHVTVALTGDAGDELFGGYNRYIHGAPAWRRLRATPRFVRAAGASVATAVGPATLDRWVARLGRLAPAALGGGRAGDKLHKLATLLPAASEEDFHRALLSYWPDPQRLVRSAPPSPLPSRLPAGLSFAERAMLHDTLHYLPDDILAKVDRASMGVSLETRVPMLDTAVYDFAWSLPMELKVAGGIGKRVLRELLYRHVPREMVDRPKQGFAVPVAAWLRGELRDWAEDLLDPVRLRDEGWLQPGPVRACWDEHQSGRRNWDTRLWTVLMFQSWLRGQSA
jgi:asparagine synthase (glutamine-hydrolysing)